MRILMLMAMLFFGALAHAATEDIYERTAQSHGTLTVYGRYMAALRMAALHTHHKFM